MSTIIYLLPPAHGHVNPTLPVIQELVTRGETIICYNTAEFRVQIEQTGAHFRAYPPMEMTPVALSRLLQDGNLARITGLILRTTEHLLPFLLDAFAHEKPDLIVFDSIALWGKMAATILGVHAVASISHFVMDEHQLPFLDIVRLLGQVLPQMPAILFARRRLMNTYGTAYPSARPLFPMRGDLNIVFTSQELQPSIPLIDATFRFVGPAINPQTRSGTSMADELGQEKVIYISLGTIHTPQSSFVRTCFAAFADYPTRVIMSVGSQVASSAIGSIPANFIVRPSVPQLDVLQQTAVFITHGGMNSIHEGLYYGVPLILIPHQVEQLLNARIVTARGAGYLLTHQLTHTQITVPILRQAVDTVMADPHYRVAAQSLQGSLRATGGYYQAADAIQSYISESRMIVVTPV